MEQQSLPAARYRFWYIFAVIAVLVLVGSFAGAYYLGKAYSTKTLPQPIAQITKQPTQEGTVCPINGVRYTPEQAAKWQDNRPLGIMIENSSAARPQSGLTKADVVYEAVAEGGITRFLAIFYCQAAQQDVTAGPVRSARTFFLDWISEYDGLYAHVGGANSPGPADALGQIIRYGIHDLNQFNYDYPYFWRDQQRLAKGYALEHTMYTSTDKLWQLADTKLGWGAQDEATKKRWDDNFLSWYFIDDPTQQASASASTITIPFWDTNPGDYTVKWTYDPAAKVYMRTDGGTAQVDAGDNQQISAKDVIIQYQTENHANDGYPGNQHLLYGTIGSGDALVFEDGTKLKATWKKASRIARTKYYDASGNEISLLRGPIWIETVPTYDESRVTVR